MNKTTRYITLAFSLFALISCQKDFLEIAPKGKLIATSVNDYDLLLNNNQLTSINSDAQVFLGDEVAAFSPYFAASDLRVKRLFSWSDTIYQADQTAPELEVPMQDIYVYNKIINEVMTASGGDEQRKRSIRAEAMAGRAWTNFLLINYYGKPYGPSSANDPGFPIITTSDINETMFTRATVQEMYNFIIDDLTKALPDLPQTVSYRIRMSRAAASAILGKVYVIMGKYHEAL